MAITVSDDFTTLYTFDNTTDESADGSIFGGSGQNNTTLKVQGTASCMYQAKGTGVGTAGKYNAGNNFNLSSTHIHGWMRSLDNFDTEANGGMRLRVTNDSLGSNSNYGEWTLGGQDTRRAVVEGFFPLVVDTTRTFDYTSGSAPALTSVDGIGMGGNMTSSSGQNTFFVDEIKEGSKTIVSGGTLGAPGTSEQLNDNDFTNGRGTFRFTLDIYAILSGFDFGDSGTGSSYFIEGGKTWVCENMPVADDYYTFTFVGNGTGTNQSKIGTETGTGTTSSGVGGHTLIAKGPPFTIIAIDSNIDAHFFGWTFDNSGNAAGVMRLEQANAKAVSCLIKNNGQITIKNGAHLRKSIIVDSVHGAGEAAVTIDEPPAANTVRELDIQNGSGYNLRLKTSSAVGSTFDLPNIKSSGAGTKDLLVEAPAQTGGNKLTINLLEGSSLATFDVTGGIIVGDVVINSAVQVTITALDAATKSPIQFAHVHLIRSSDKAVILSAATDASGVATTSYNYLADIAVSGWVRQMDLAGTDYTPKDMSGTLDANGFNLTVELEPI